jgi:cohesin loading factor subunit SCC2
MRANHRRGAFIARKRLPRTAENGKEANLVSVDSFLMCFFLLIFQVFEPKESKNDETKGKKEISPTLIKSCQQIANGLVNSIMELEKCNGPRLVGCVTALHSFAQIRPHLLVEHAISLEPYLNIKCSVNEQFKFIGSLAEILEQVRTMQSLK